VALRSTLEQFYAHPLYGFLEDRSGRLPQRSNPHMHLFEAALAWIAVDDDPAWRRMADGIAVLCLQKFVNPASGALREFFAADWSPAPGAEGRICEPGHHYEWAFLLDRWARLTDRNKPEAVARLIAFADAHGLDARRGVVVNASGPTAASTTRSHARGRRQNGSVPIPRTAEVRLVESPAAGRVMSERRPKHAGRRRECRTVDTRARTRSDYQKA
jgi:mannose/cellobiose epimerase-like protein (N-acyl-D-glucosamine 2-epimerase family)